MIHKSLFFYVNIICTFMISLPCFAMLPSWLGGDSPDVQWDACFFQLCIADQNYSVIMPLLYQLLNDTSTNTLVYESIKNTAEAGDVAMMYLFLRNKNTALDKKVVISSPEWIDIGKYLLISFIYVYQDEKYCTDIKHVREKTNSWFGGEKYQRDILTIFRTKFAQWFKNQPLEKNIPFQTALKLAKEWFETHKNLPHPIWVKYCYGKWLSQSGQIIFDTPHKCSKISTEKRVQCYKEAYNTVSKMGSWYVLFTPSIIQQQENDDRDDSKTPEEENENKHAEDNKNKPDETKNDVNNKTVENTNIIDNTSQK